MSITTTKLTAATSAVSNITTPMTEIENWMGSAAIATGDLDDGSPWLDSAHIIRPEFYGSPSPRAVAQGGNVFWARRGAAPIDSMVITEDSSRALWLPIPGLAKTIHGEPHLANSAVEATVTAVFHIYENEGPGGTVADEAATVSLRTGTGEGVLVTGTKRSIYITGTGQYGQRLTHVMEAVVTLQRGVNHVWTGLNINTSASGAGRAHLLINITAASFIVEVEPL